MSKDRSPLGRLKGSLKDAGINQQSTHVAMPQACFMPPVWCM